MGVDDLILLEIVILFVIVRDNENYSGSVVIFYLGTAGEVGRFRVSLE